MAYYKNMDQLIAQLPGVLAVHRVHDSHCVQYRKNITPRQIGMVAKWFRIFQGQIQADIKKLEEEMALMRRSWGISKTLDPPQHSPEDFYLQPILE